MVRPKNGSMAEQGSRSSPSFVLTVTASSCRRSPCSAVTWPMSSLIFPVGDERAHLLDRVGRAAELVAPVQQRQAFGDRLEVERPVERRVAAADDEHVLAAQVLHAAHGVVHGRALVGLDAFERRTLRRERAAARGDHDDLGAGTDLPASVRDPEAAVSPSAPASSTRSPRWNCAPNGLICSISRSVSSWPVTIGEARNVVDRLLGIELGALAAGLVRGCRSRAP